MRALQEMAELEGRVTAQKEALTEAKKAAEVREFLAHSNSA